MVDRDEIEAGDCDTCCGDGCYPIHNKYGARVMWIDCPQCSGSGMSERSARQREQAALDKQRYEAAMNAAPPLSGQGVR